ncbi:amino acid--tRNA ligase-related protein [Candidatus Vidania fulgoroideorum]
MIFVSRIKEKRVIGGICFFKLKKIKNQFIIKKNIFKEKYKKNLKKIFIGNICKIDGILFKNNKNVKCILVKKIKILSKNILKLPDKYNKIKDKKIIYNKSYFTMFYNKKKYNIIKKRFLIINFIRKFMNKRNFIEVETPILNKNNCGSDVKEFFVKKKKKKLFLRISPEINLKKMLICGFDKIYEIGKNFRNENNSNKHKDEFTMMEFYINNKNYKWNMLFLREIIINIFKLFKKKIFFKKIKYSDIIKKYNNIDIIKKKKSTIFVTHFPILETPLAKESKKKGYTESFELYINGIEIANGYTELNKYKEQKKRFLIQKKNNNKKIDKLFLEYMKFGMPPSTGCGIGIDRLIMSVFDKKINDVILFK